MWLRKTLIWFRADHHTLYVAVPLIAVAWYFIDPTYNMIHVLYSAMWSNMWAPSIWTLGGILVADIRNERRHKATKDHHAGVIEGLVGQIDGLSDRIKSLIPGGDNDNESRTNRADPDPR